MAAAVPVFLYDTLSPLGDTRSEDGEEAVTFPSSFLPLEGAGSPSGENLLMEQATSTLTVERQETTPSRTVDQKKYVTAEGRNLETLIAAEKDSRTDASTPENFRARRDTSVSSDMGVHSVINNYSLSRTNIETITAAQVEEHVEETEYISLDLGGGSVETVVQEVVQFKGKQVVTLGALTPKEAPPWARGRDTWIQSPLLQLHQEIVDFCEFVAPTEEEQQLRAIAVQRVSAVVKSIWPACQVKVFGSFATGLYLPTSDVDVVVLDSGCQARQDGLKALAKALTRNLVAKSIQVIGKARVPIVKFVETHSNIPFDISFDVANGPEAADFIKAAMEALPPLRPLSLVLKIFLQQRELNEVYQGGIGSYALLVMLLTHLQTHPSKRRASSRSQVHPLESNLGILLVDFLDLYGRTLNMKDVGVSCRSGGRFFSKKDRGFNDSKRPYLLCVEDPQSPDNDIGKNSFAIQKAVHKSDSEKALKCQDAHYHVRSAFVMAHRLLTNLNGDNDVGLLGRIVRMDPKLVERKVPVSLIPIQSDLPSRRPHPVTYAGYHYQSIPEPEPEPYVVGDGTFSNSESDDAPKFKTPETGQRGRWHDYDDDFPRGDSVDGYLSKKARKAKKFKERVRDKDQYATPKFAYDRYRDSPHTPQEGTGNFSRKRARRESLATDQNLHGKHTPKVKQSSKNTESSGPEEGEVRLGRRARKREEFLRWKAEKSQEEKDLLPDSKRQRNASTGNEKFSARVEKAAARSKGQNQHTHWNEHDVVDNRRSSKQSSRFREIPARTKGSDGQEGFRSETSELTRRLVITKPAHKKIKYV